MPEVTKAPFARMTGEILELREEMLLHNSLQSPNNPTGEDLQAVNHESVTVSSRVDFVARCRGSVG